MNDGYRVNVNSRLKFECKFPRIERAFVVNTRILTTKAVTLASRVRSPESSGPRE